MSKVSCNVCPKHCSLREGDFGRCGARVNEGGTILSKNYGKLTAIALDPIEKKPLSFFHPGSWILSVGSFGCNLFCPFCQNHEIARATSKEAEQIVKTMSPDELCELAYDVRDKGNIGLAFTYNEPLIGYEYVRDTARLLKERGMVNVVVTNGMATEQVLQELLPYIDAMNIDLKGFTDEIYQRLGGDLRAVQEFIVTAARSCHVEITSLIVPGLNDSIDDMRRQAKWLADIDPNLPLHITRYFPRYQMNTPATDIGLLQRLKDEAGIYLKRVRLGNV